MKITDELLAAYAEGNTTPEEREAVRHYLAANPDDMRSVLFTMEHGMDCDLECHTLDNDTYLDNLGAMLDEIDYSTQQCSVLPMTALAAQNDFDNQCVVRCEGFALRHFGIDITDEDLIEESARNGWLQPEGTALHNIGRLSGTRGLSVSHRYHCSTETIRDALLHNEIIIAAIDGNELIGNQRKKHEKELTIGLTPNHVVIVTALTDTEVTVIDSATPDQQDTYPLPQFLDAWEDSSNYLIVISDNNEYTPHPISLDDVVVEEELIELREAMAENAHEVWADARRKEGWLYGPVRDDIKKQHPDMLPYNRLPESEKEYDRLMAMNTIKLVKKLGWELRKVQPSRHYPKLDHKHGNDL